MRGSLSEVLSSRNTYELEQSSTRRPYDPALLNVVKQGVQAKELRPLVDDTARTFLDNPDKYILKSDAEIDATPDSEFGLPYTDPVLTSSPQLMHDLIVKLHELGLIVFKRAKVATVGLFTVAKKDGTLRLVFDCRPANALHRPPPTTHLATSGAFGNLDWSADAIDEGGKHSDTPVHFAGVDLIDSFYQFSWPELAAYFWLKKATSATKESLTETSNR